MRARMLLLPASSRRDSLLRLSVKASGDERSSARASSHPAAGTVRAGLPAPFAPSCVQASLQRLEEPVGVQKCAVQVHCLPSPLWMGLDVGHDAAFPQVPQVPAHWT